MAAQVSRLFSALLQLANNGNIVILRGSNPGESFQLRLTSLEKKHQHFQDYRAPSFLKPKVRAMAALQTAQYRPAPKMCPNCIKSFVRL